MWVNKAGTGFSFIATPFPNAGLIPERNCDQPLILVTAVEVPGCSQPQAELYGAALARMAGTTNYERSFCLSGNLNIDHRCAFWS